MCMVCLHECVVLDGLPWAPLQHYDRTFHNAPVTICDTIFFFSWFSHTHTNTHICIYIVWFTVPSSLAATHAASGTPLFSLWSPHQSQCSTKDVFLFTDFFFFFYVTYSVELIFTCGPIPLCLTQRTLFISVKINDPRCFDMLVQRQASWTIEGKVSTIYFFSVDTQLAVFAWAGVLNAIIIEFLGVFTLLQVKYCCLYVRARRI